MSEAPENNKDIQDTEELFNVSNIFSKRKPLERTNVDNAEAKAADSSEKKETQHKLEKPSTTKEPENEDETAEGPAPEEDKIAAKGIDYQKEVEKLNKTLKDTQRSFHEDRKKLSAYKKAVEKLKAEGTLLDEEATLLLDHTRFENEAGDEVDEPVIIKYARIWDKEIEYMKKYSTNSESIAENIEAFEHLIQSSSEKEQQEILDELSLYKDNEVQFTKQMIEMGRQYNDDIYSDIRKAGNIRNLKSILYKNEEELQKKVDKLQKQYDNLKKKYEDYDDSPATKISSGPGNGDLHAKKDTTFDVGKIFANRYRRQK